MRRLLLSALLAFSACWASAQQHYGNEWINYDQRYWSFWVSADQYGDPFEGLWRIDSSTLANAGFPVAQTDARSIQVWGHERQVPICFPGDSDGVEIGPLIDQKAIEKVERMVAEALASGATALTGGTKHAAGAQFYTPTVLTNVTRDMRVNTEEIFGPVAPLIRFKTEDEAVSIANDTPFGLASYFFTKHRFIFGTHAMPTLEHTTLPLASTTQSSQSLVTKAQFLRSSACDEDASDNVMSYAWSCVADSGSRIESANNFFTMYHVLPHSELPCL